jgi:hypothetical protein
MSRDATLGILIGLAFTLTVLLVRSIYLKRQNRRREAAR